MTKLISVPRPGAASDVKGRHATDRYSSAQRKLLDGLKKFRERYASRIILY